MSKYFNYKEQRCPHCGQTNPDEEFLDVMDKLREKYGRPIFVNSWYRCKEHDEAIGGKGAHQTGKAVDIKVLTSLERYDMLRAAFEMGFQRIGVGSTFVHVDMVKKNYPQEVLWLY